MTGRSFLDILLSGKSGWIDPQRDKIFAECERIMACREDNKSYPVRAIRTGDFLYVRNLRPHLWPVGPPSTGFGDMNGGPTKAEMLGRKDDPVIAPYYKLGFTKLPAEELYDMSKDPGQLTNVAGKPQYAEVKKKLRTELDRWMAGTGDPRAQGETDFWDDKCPYFGGSRFLAPK